MLDAPWGRAFQSWHPWTETVGRWFFASITEVLGIPGVPLSFFEFCSLLICSMVLFRSNGNREIRQLRSDGAAKSVILAIPLLIIVGATFGVLYGNDFSTILTQTRSMVTLPLWVFIGYTVFNRHSDQLRFYVVLVLAMIFKSLQGLYYHYIVLGGEKGEREFLVEHITSTFLVTAIFALLFWAAIKYQRLMQRLFMIAIPISLLLAAFLLNDRRAALIGVLFSVVVLVVSLPIRMMIRLIPLTLLGAMGICVFLVVTWDYRGALGFPAKTIRSLMDPEESSAGYRKVEDANLLLAVASEPLTGLGFGRRFPVIYELPDIAGIYAEFDLVPHNTLLYVWTFAGPTGMAAFGVFMVLSLTTALRLWRSGPLQVVGVLGGLGTIVLISGLVFIYADLGLREVRLMALMGSVAGGLLALQRSGGEVC